MDAAIQMLWGINAQVLDKTCLFVSLFGLSCVDVPKKRSGSSHYVFSIERQSLALQFHCDKLICLWLVTLLFEFFFPHRI